MNIKPLGNRVLVKPVEAEEKTKGGIFLPETVSKEKPNMAELIALGNGEEVKDISIGQKVIYKKYSGTEIKQEGITYIILDIEDVLAVTE